MNLLQRLFCFVVFWLRFAICFGWCSHVGRVARFLFILAEADKFLFSLNFVGEWFGIFPKLFVAEMSLTQASAGRWLVLLAFSSNNWSSSKPDVEGSSPSAPVVLSKVKRLILLDYSSESTFFVCLRPNYEKQKKISLNLCCIVFQSLCN